MSESATLNLGAILYPGFELLDLFGPLEMFANVGAERLKIIMVAAQAGEVAAGSVADGIVGPRAVADFGFDDAPDLDILLLPGGVGTFAALQDEALLAFLRKCAEHAQIMASVCTGSAILAKAGVLDGHRATSNKQVFDLARNQSGAVEWIERARWVDDGAVVTSSGVSAGMDMSLAIIQRLFGADVANNVAEAAEYTWHRNADEDPFADQLNKMSGILV